MKLGACFENLCQTGKEEFVKAAAEINVGLVFFEDNIRSGTATRSRDTQRAEFKKSLMLPHSALSHPRLYLLAYLDQKGSTLKHLVSAEHHQLEATAEIQIKIINSILFLEECNCQLQVHQNHESLTTVITDLINLKLMNIIFSKRYLQFLSYVS